MSLHSDESKQKLSTDCKNDYHFWKNQGIELLKSRYYEEAIVAFDHALKLNPNDYEVLYHKAGALETVERCEEARAILYKVLELKPDFLDAWELLNNVLWVLEHYDEAARSCEKVAEISHSLNLDEDAIAWYFQAIEAWEELSFDENSDEILACYDKALNIQSCQLELLHRRSQVLYRLRKYIEAIEDIDKFLEVDPDESEVTL